MCVDAPKNRIETVLNVLFVDDMLSCRSALVASTLPEVRHEYEGTLIVDSHHEVIRGDIAMNVACLVQSFNPVEDL